MPLNLVTTPIKSTFSNNNIIVGEWCKEQFQKKENSKTKLSEYHWDDTKKMKKDFYYLDGLYKKSILSLTKSLNAYHNINKPERYWEIILSSFLSYIIQIVWDRWETIRHVTKSFPVEETRAVNPEENPLTFQDFEDFLKNFNDHYWNHHLFLRIIKFLNPNIDIINIREKNLKLNTYNENLSLKYSLLDKVLSYFARKNSVVLKQTGFETKKLIKLFLKLRQIPTLHSELNKKFIKKKMNRSNLLLNIDPKNDFETFFEKILLDLLPYSYIENYKEAIKEAKKIKLKPKIIFTSYSHTVNDFFKIWTAEKTLEKVRYIVSDHGPNIEDDAKRNFNSHSNFADLYTTWTRPYDLKKQMSPTPSIYFEKIKQGKNNLNKILLLGGRTILYPYKMQTGPIAGQMLKTFRLWDEFYLSLSQEKRNLFKLRPHPKDDWKSKDFFYKKYGKKIISDTSNFKQDALTSRIVVNTAFETTFYHCMFSDIPTILIFNENLFFITKDLEKLFEKFQSAQILFSKPNDAAKHIDKIWSNPFEWWNSNKVNEAKTEFYKNFFLKAEDEVENWTSFFKNQMKILTN
jgi:putative transferase (TIGR04331 family)|tara:strand:+ start:139 stop:1860 length:1722 start_codon:yes stop_codon:yes gene_type:complete